MKFTFTTKGGNEYVLDLDPTTSIRDAKQFFQILYSLNSERITIIFHNRIISDSETLSNFIEPTLPGLYIISDDIHDCEEDSEIEKNDFPTELPSLPSSISDFTSQSQKNYSFERFTISEAINQKLINFNYQNTPRLSRFYPDNFTSFKVILINSNNVGSYENYNNIPHHTVVADLSKTIGEALKTTVVQNASSEYNSINKLFILRAKTHMTQYSKLYKYNLHSLSLISFNCESVIPKFVNVVVFLQNQKGRQISYCLYNETYILDFKKTVARDFFSFSDPSAILLTLQNNIMVDDKKIKDYNLINNAIIEVKESKLTSGDVMVVVERLFGSLGFSIRSKSIIYELKKLIQSKIKLHVNKQVLIYNHQMIIKEFQERIGNLSKNKVFSVQLRTKDDPVYGVEFETGIIYYFDVKDDQNVLNLKMQIRDVMGIPVTNICLIYNNEVLNDKATMNELSIAYFSVITCKKQGFYENIPIKLKTPFLDIQQFISPQTYVTDIAEIASQRNNVKYGEKVNVYIPILLFDQNTKMSQIEHCQETKFILCERRANSFFITIKTVFNDFFYLPVYPEMSVRHLTSLIQLLLNIDEQDSSCSLRLMCYGIILREKYTLGQYKIKPNIIIDAYLCPS